MWLTPTGSVTIKHRTDKLLTDDGCSKSTIFTKLHKTKSLLIHHPFTSKSSYSLLIHYYYSLFYIFFGFLSRVQNIVGVTFYFWLFLYHLKLSLLKYTLRKSYYCTGSHKQTRYCTRDFPSDAPDLSGKAPIK